MGKMNGCSKSVKHRQHEAGKAVLEDSRKQGGLSLKEDQEHQRKLTTTQVSEPG